MELLANAVIDKATGRALEYKHLIKTKEKETWFTSCANDFGRSAQGVGTRMKEGTNTIFLYQKTKFPRTNWQHMPDLL
eukprot:10000671-Ditylum_brightwellii.AAC.1